VTVVDSSTPYTASTLFQPPVMNSIVPGPLPRIDRVLRIRALLYSCENVNRVIFAVFKYRHTVHSSGQVNAHGPWLMEELSILDAF
jgi:hypothetical protein